QLGWGIIPLEIGSKDRISRLIRGWDNLSCVLCWVKSNTHAVVSYLPRAKKSRFRSFLQVAPEFEDESCFPSISSLTLSAYPKK
ncbi:MAG: hypothetical protein OXC17_11240, partial [Aestuariivita sp.]|nr:hypothetical protein [Aestuariivita sp.]